MRYFVLAIALLLFPSFSDASIRPVDFAYGRPLLLKGNGAVYRFEVPLEVYETVSTNDLSDIGIFNSAGVAVPHILRLPETKGGISESTKPLPFFPLYRKENETEKNGLSVRIDRREDGTIIDITSDDAGVGNKRQLSGYLIDLGRHETPIHALDLTWPEDTEDFISDVALEYSSDLTRWTTLAFRSTIALKRFNGQEIVRKRIRLPARVPEHVSESRGKTGGGIAFGSHSVQKISEVNFKTGYLRLRWLSDNDRVELNEILAVQQTGTPRQERIWTAIDAIAAAADSTGNTTAYEYDNSAWLPVDRIQIGFTEKNTLAKVRIFSRPDMASKWRYRQSSVFYHLEFEKAPLVQDTVDIDTASDRYWRLEVEGSGSGGSGKSPFVRLGWLPHEVLFVAQGEGPFMMAFGSARLGEDEPGKNSPELISQIVGKNGDALIEKAVLLGEKIVLGGPGLLVPPPPPLAWRDWLLWCVLVLGVGIIAKMAVSLFKGLDTHR